MDDLKPGWRTIESLVPLIALLTSASAAAVSSWQWARTGDKAWICVVVLASLCGVLAVGVRALMRVASGLSIESRKAAEKVVHYTPNRNL
jgi:hypothetical protein